LSSKTADGKIAVDGMSLFSEGLDDEILECHVKTEAYWIASNGSNWCGPVDRFFSRPQGGKPASV